MVVLQCLTMMVLTMKFLITLNLIKTVFKIMGILMSTSEFMGI